MVSLTSSLFDKIDLKKYPILQKHKLPSKMTSKIATENTTKYYIHQSEAQEEGLVILQKIGTGFPPYWMPTSCHAIIKSGKRKGEICYNVIEYKSMFCGTHEKCTIENLPDALKQFLKSENVTLNKGVIQLASSPETEDEDEPEYTESELKKKTVKELKKIAKIMGRKGYSKMRKADLINSLKS